MRPTPDRTSIYTGAQLAAISFIITYCMQLYGQLIGRGLQSEMNFFDVDAAMLFEYTLYGFLAGLLGSFFLLKKG